MWSARLDGIKAFRQGEFHSSVAHFERAMSYLSTKAWLSPTSGVLYLLGLLATRQTDKVVSAYKRIPANDAGRDAARILAALAEYQLGLGRLEFDWTQELLHMQGWAVFLATLVLCSAGDKARVNMDRLEEARKQVEVLYPWIHLAIIQLREWIDTSSPASHPIVRAVPWPETWQRRLEQLERAANKGAGAARDSRLTWRLGPGPRLQPYLQQRQKGGVWNQGRIAYSLPECATSTDEEIFKARVGYGPEYDWDRVLPLLAGHPYLRDSHGAPLTLRQQMVRIVVEELKDRYVINIDPIVSRLTLTFVSEAEAVFCTPTAVQKTLIKQLVHALEVPVNGADSLQAVLESLSSHLEVDQRVDLLQSVPEVAPDARLRINLSPAGEGLLVEVRVQPVGERGFPPGRGAEVLTGVQNGRRVKVRRDLGEEEAEARALCEACPALVSLGPPDWNVDAPELESALAMLSELEALGNSVCVQWPHGQKFKVLQRGPSHLKLPLPDGARVPAGRLAAEPAERSRISGQSTGT
jgi:hypothetical protein